MTHIKASNIWAFMAGVSFFMTVDSLAQLKNIDQWYLPFVMFLLATFGCVSIVLDRRRTGS